MAELALSRELSTKKAPTHPPAPLHTGDLFRTLASLADALTAVFGPACEVVVHDFSDLDRSIVHITGSVTNRHIGGTVTDLGLAILKQGQVPDSLINYPTYAPDGHPLRSTSVFLKDSSGAAIGCICLNIDTSRLPLPGDTSRAAGGQAHQPMETFADSPEEVTRNTLDRFLVANGFQDARNLSRAQRIELIRKLDQAGVFFLRGAADIVARQLGITRSTVYVYLRAATAHTNKEA